MEMGELLRKARLEAGLTQRALCGDPDHPQYALADRERNGPPLHGDAAVPGGCPGQARELFPGRGRAYGEPAAHAPGPAGLCREALSGGPVHPGGLRDPGRDPGLGAGPPWVPVLPEPCGGGRPGGAAACGPEAPGPGPALRGAPYITPDLRTRQELLAQQLGQKPRQKQLPSLDGELLLRARLALDGGDADRALALLAAWRPPLRRPWCWRARPI